LAVSKSLEPSRSLKTAEYSSFKLTTMSNLGTPNRLIHTPRCISTRHIDLPRNQKDISPRVKSIEKVVKRRDVEVLFLEYYETVTSNEGADAIRP
jgi:hypothetical protein